jgi:hypothetical protein
MIEMGNVPRDAQLITEIVQDMKQADGIGSAGHSHHHLLSPRNQLTGADKTQNA